jgi:hypothetical protein
MANMLLRESRVDRLYGLGQSMGAPVDALRHSPYTGAAEATIPPPLAPVSSRIRHQHGIPRAQQERAHPHPGIPCTVHQDFTGAVGGETA